MSESLKQSKWVKVVERFSKVAVVSEVPKTSFVGTVLQYYSGPVQNSQVVTVFSGDLLRSLVSSIAIPARESESSRGRSPQILATPSKSIAL